MSSRVSTVEARSSSCSFRTAILLQMLLFRRRWRSRPDRTDELDPPYWSSEIQRSLRLDEGRRFAAENPHVRVRRLLADERGDQPGQTADLDLHDVVHRFAAGRAGRA